MSSIKDSVKEMGPLFSVWLTKPHRACKEAAINTEIYQRAAAQNKNAGWAICEFKKANNQWDRL